MKAFRLPGLHEVVTDSYLDKVVRSGTWTPHGSDIGRYFEDIDNTFVLENDVNLKQHLKDVYFPDRYRYVMNLLAEELESLSERPVILRAMKVPAKDWPEFKENMGKQPVGLYWSFSRPEGHCSGKGKGVDVVLHAEFDPNQINWTDTLRSRMDYDLGDEEEELQLFPTAIPRIIDFEFESTSINEPEQEASI
jgi:hypothetical protein